MESNEDPAFSRGKNIDREAFIDPRAARLAPEERKIYEETLSFRERYHGQSTLSPEDIRTQDRRWSDFMWALLGADTIPLGLYAGDPARFPSEKYALQYLVSDDPYVFNPNFTYRERDTIVVEPHSKRRIYLDAPYGLTILYRHDEPIITRYGYVPAQDPHAQDVSHYEPISTASFVIDLKRRVLLIDHLQGGDTDNKRATAEGKAARAIFEIGEGKERQNAETALFDAICELARRAGFRGVGLRKAPFNLWPSVHDAHKAGKSNPYDRVAHIKKLKGFAAKEYFLIPLED